MEGYVRKRGTKWYYSFEASSVNGKRKRIERVGGRTKKEAQGALRKALQAYENAGVYFEPTEISMSDYMDYWFKNHVLVNCKHNTQVSYRGIITKHVKPALGIYKLKSLTPALLQEFVNEKYRSGISKSHLSCIMNVLSSALRYAVHPCAFIKDNPLQYIKKPKYEHTALEERHKIVSRENFRRIIERFPPGSDYYIPLIIGYYTGFRIGEVMALTWDDVDLAQNSISINKIVFKKSPDWIFGSTKTKTSVRTIKIGTTLANILQQHKKRQLENRLEYGQHYTLYYEFSELDPETGKSVRKIISKQTNETPGTLAPVSMVCTRASGILITPDSFKSAAYTIHKQLKINFNFHSLRHTHATMLIENGANIKDVQARLGHTNIKTTLDTYTHATETMAEKSVEIFELAAADAAK